MTFDDALKGYAVMHYLSFWFKVEHQKNTSINVISLDVREHDEAQEKREPDEALRMSLTVMIDLNAGKVVIQTDVEEGEVLELKSINSYGQPLVGTVADLLSQRKVF